MRVLRGSLISQRDPQNNDEIGDPGSPKCYDTERNLIFLESWHRIMCGHNRVAIVFRREPVVRLPRIAMKWPGMCKLSKVVFMQL